MRAETTGAVWHAFRRGIPGDRKGPGRTVLEICEAVGEGHKVEDVLAALDVLGGAGELAGCVFDQGADAAPGSEVRRRLYWRPEDARKPVPEAA